MAVTKWRSWRFRAILLAILLDVVYGYEEMYTISQLSPKSASRFDSPEDTVLQTSHTENLAFNIEPSSIYEDIDQINNDLNNNENFKANKHLLVTRSADSVRESSSIDVDLDPIDHLEENNEEDRHFIVARSADNARESRSINVDNIPSTNNEIDNELEIHHKRKYYDIHPTKTVDYLHSNDDVILSSEGFGDKLEFRFPGEGKRVPYGRALPPMGPRIRPTAVQPIFATATHRGADEGRQNTEIQNIITGIVKLLNGNVNVQANTQLLGRPSRPMASRINNRGPPRISDVPPLPDFDKPPPHSFVPTKTPPPYPFDRPPVHVNLPEQIVPPLAPRPGLHRPIPPWQRPRPRPPNRRPNPGLPMYKPNKPIIHQDISDTESEERPEEVTINENETVHLENAIHHDESANPYIIEVSTEKEPEKTPEITTPELTTKETTTTSTTTTTTTTTTTEKPTTTTEKPTTTTEKPTTTEKLTTTEKPKTEKPTKLDKEKKKDPITEKEKQKHKVAEEQKQTKENITLSKPEKLPEQLQNEVDNTTITTEIPTIKTNDVDFEVKPEINVIKSDTLIELQSSLTDTLPMTSSLSPTPTEGLMSTSSTIEFTSKIETSSINSQPLPSSSVPYHPYRPRPGIVLDDTDFKPHGSRFSHRPEAPVITAPSERLPGYGEIFDVTVSAIQGPGEKGASVHIETVNINHDQDIIVSPSGEQGFVSIDGKRTYLNLFDTTTTSSVRPTRVQQVVHQSVPPLAPPPLAHGQGVAIPTDDVPSVPPIRRPQPTHPVRNRPHGYRPQPTVRIDTCIVGDDSTCDKAQNEKCRTEAGISSCQCRPGFARRTNRDPCRRVVSLLLNLRVDRIYDRKVAWDPKLGDKESEPYQQLSYEAVRAIDSAFSMTPFSDDFVGATVNTIHKGDENNRGVFVNCTILMQETPESIRPSIAIDIQKHMLGVIRRRSNNVGASALWVDSVAGSVLPLHDLDECASPDFNDCHQLASCLNTWGAFKCTCPDSTLDSGSIPGRQCKSCPASQCSERGTCRYSNGQPYCTCSGGYYGSRCEVDGEVVGVALGASLAAALVIGATLAALLSWSRKWSREQKAVGMGSPVFNYMASNTVKTPPVGQPPYQVTMEERLRWAQIAEAMVQANHYASEAQTMATRPSSAMFGGYPTLPHPPVPLPRMGIHGHHNGTMNTITSRANGPQTHHNLYGYTNHMANESTSSEASSHVQDRADLLVPRPKSRARSMHNHTGIYYDVDYENAEPIYGTKGIPLSTYTVSRGPPFYRT